MATKLFPPILDTKLPAFEGNQMKIPFTMNKAVAYGDISKMKAIIKTASTGKTLKVLESAGKPNELSEGFVVSFDCSGLKLEVGQYYKVQIAYVDQSGEVGYYSSAGIIKKTHAPQLSILELEDTIGVSDRFEYTGCYKQKPTMSSNGKTVIEKADTLEKVYSYQFTIKDLKQNIIDTSGVCLHNSSDDNENDESTDKWSTNARLEIDEMYVFTYEVTTTNGYTNSCSYTVSITESVDIDLNIALETKLNYEDGIVELYLLPKTGQSSFITGDFVLSRSSSLTNFKLWDKVHNFSYVNMEISASNPLLLWEDYTVHQGETYQYAIQAYNSNNLFSNKLESNNGNIKADFEDCFLADAEHQLKICFNTKISSFKSTVVESKTTTLGSKFPYIFKNGYVNYKEFPISGLLSLLSDSNGKFKDIYSQAKDFQKRKTTPGFGENATYGNHLTSENIYNERQFKTEVLEWLNNGKPKIFRSPTEGNFLVRIMNVSLAPNDTLGRMLHTLSCQACEIAEYNFQNLINYDLISFPVNRTLSLRVGQIIPANIMFDPDRVEKYPNLSFTSGNTSLIQFPPIYSASITDAEPGTQFRLSFFNDNTDRIIEIGGTGTYIVPIAKAPEDSMAQTCYLETIKLEKGNWGNTKINFEYYEAKPFDTFSAICDISTETLIRRFVGPGFDRNLVAVDNGNNTDFDRILTDIKREPGMFYYIKAEKRYVQEMWQTADGKYSRTQKPSTDIIEDKDWNPLVIYHDNTTNTYYNGSLKNKMSAPDYSFSLNGDEYSDLGFNITEKNKTKYSDSFGRIDNLRNIKKVTSLRAGTGILLDVAYRQRIKEYTIEKNINSSMKELSEAKANLDNAKKELKNIINGTVKPAAKDIDKKIKEKTDNMNKAYQAYITTLKTQMILQGVK